MSLLGLGGGDLVLAPLVHTTQGMAMTALQPGLRMAGWLVAWLEGVPFTGFGPDFARFWQRRPPTLPQVRGKVVRFSGEGVPIFGEMAGGRRIRQGALIQMV